MFRIWFERPVPSVYLELLDGIATPIHSNVDSPGWPYDTLVGADGVVASAVLKYNAELFAKVPTLRVVSRTGIGVDNIAIPEATAHGVAICNLPEGPTVSTAEHAVALILGVTKHIKKVENALRKGGKQDYFGASRSMELDGRVLGLVGLGRIGARVAKIANAIGMKVIAHDPFVSAERATELGVMLVPSLEELLSTSDVVSLHLPATAETRHLINAERLALMKPGAYLVNAARGPLIDEAALLNALESGHLAGAGLDVFDPEPPSPDNPLLHREDVIATPHVASATLATKDRMWRDSIKQALQVLRGERPPHLVNPDVWPLRAK